jgi:hypothetical protein
MTGEPPKCPILTAKPLTNDCRLAGILDTPLDPTLAAQRLTTMPALLSAALPPCGLELQIAYQNVIHRLRLLWLQTPAPTTLLSLCETIDLALAHENASSRPTPWRRATVFAHELRWIKYFVREAAVAEEWGNMTTEEKRKQELIERMYTMPKELGINFRKKENRKRMLELWEAWNAEKRADRSQLEENDEGWETDEVEEWESGKGDGGEKKDDGDRREVEGGMNGLEI